MRTQGVLIEKRACPTCNYFSYALNGCMYDDKLRLLSQEKMNNGCEHHDPWVNAEFCPKCGSHEVFPLRNSVGGKKIKCFGCNIVFAPILYSGG